jgi:N-ethylmaleimide reductase
VGSDLFEPFELGDLELANRIVMAPMTRNRADENGEATPEMAAYYRQRASAGLIITESAPVSPGGVGYPYTPGIYTEAQARSWLRVTNAVHSAGGRIFIQLLHGGRISHPSLLSGAAPVAPSAIKPEGRAVTLTGPQDFVTPRALATEEIAGIVEEYRRATALALRAGFDGVEVHGGNGYLLDQFLRDGTNHRNEPYGGSAENRLRLLTEVLDAVQAVYPAGRIGVRVTPENAFNSMSDSDPEAHFSYYLEQLGQRGIAYIHVLEGDMMKKPDIAAGFSAIGATGPGGRESLRGVGLDYRALRARFVGTYVANNAYSFKSASEAVSTNAADLVAFGTPFLANPDLVRRFRDNLPLNTADPSTFYVGGEVGYTDYPFFRRPDDLGEPARAIA